ncbi:hypothetical protein [Falsirhodobacter sp. 1013]|uniref:hypothetical protein n=1 Tax=Falsirhodobacter sp. 1013 TaxID=3417566 RepID=UPI003EBC5EE0
MGSLMHGPVLHVRSVDGAGSGRNPEHVGRNNGVPGNDDFRAMALDRMVLNLLSCAFFIFSQG